MAREKGNFVRRSIIFFLFAKMQHFLLSLENNQEHTISPLCFNQFANSFTLEFNHEKNYRRLCGHGSTLKSLHLFLETHNNAFYGIRFSVQNHSVCDHVHSYPLYAVAQVVLKNKDIVLEALL